jgi:hypothetical protein
MPPCAGWVRLAQSEDGAIKWILNTINHKSPNMCDVFSCTERIKNKEVTHLWTYATFTTSLPTSATMCCFLPWTLDPFRLDCCEKVWDKFEESVALTLRCLVVTPQISWLLVVTSLSPVSGYSGYQKKLSKFLVTYNKGSQLMAPKNLPIQLPASRDTVTVPVTTISKLSWKVWQGSPTWLYLEDHLPRIVWLVSIAEVIGHV